MRDGTGGVGDATGLAALGRHDPDVCTVVEIPVLVPGGDERDQPAVGRPRGARVRDVAIRDLSRRAAVASWYLRLRDPAGHDPMWGLVRIEAADRRAAESPDELTARADRISRWVLAEAAPLALPDGRWDKMVYGVRDCEEFLRAVS